QAFAFGALIASQARQESNGNGMSRELFGCLRREVREGDRARRQRVVTDYPLVAARHGDVRLAQAPFLVLADEIMEKRVETGLAPPNRLALVCLIQGFDDPISHGDGYGQGISCGLSSPRATRRWPPAAFPTKQETDPDRGRTVARLTPRESAARLPERA